MPQQWYALGPITVEVTCVDTHQQQRVDALWHLLFQVQQIDAQAGAPTIQFQFMRSVDAQTLLTHGVELFRYAQIQIWQWQGRFGLTCGDTIILIDSEQNLARGRLGNDFWEMALASQREFFQLIFFLLLRRQGLYLLHANAVVPPAASASRALLLVGDCGTGKTTLTVSLLERDWQCVGDDLLMLQQTKAHVTAYGVRRGISCAPPTATAFPALDALMPEGPELWRDKKFIQIERLYPMACLPSCQPQAILFTQIVDAEQSWLAPLTATQTMLALLQQPRAGILVDPPTVAGQLALFRGLVGQAGGFQLYLGRDVLQHPAQVSTLLARIGQS